MKRLLLSVFVLFVLACLGTATNSVPTTLADEAQPSIVEIPVRVQTPAYKVTADGVSVEGYQSNTVPGAPNLPVWSTLVELPATGSWQVSYRSVGAHAVDGQVEVPSVAVPDWTGGLPSLTNGETVPSTVPVTERPDPTIYQRDALYPTAPVVIGEEQWQRGKRLLVLRAFPFQYNPQTRSLLHHPDLQIVVRVSPAEVADVPLRAPETLINSPAVGQGISGAVRLYTQARGLFKVTYEALQGAGVPVSTLTPATLAMSYLGQSVDIQVVGEEDGQFNPGDFVLFYAEPYTGRYMKENVYWLSYGGAAGARIAHRSVTPSGTEPIVDKVPQLARVERNTIYMSTFHRPNDADHWFDSAMIVTGASTVSRIYALTLDDYLTEGNVTVQVQFHGTYDNAVNPDHSVKVYLNSHLLGTYQWNGAIDYLVSATAPASWLDGSPNQLKFEAALSQFPVGSAPPTYTVYPDWAEVTYTARADAEENRILLDRVAEGSNKVVVSGFTTSATDPLRVFDLRDPRHLVQLDSVTVVDNGGTSTAHFWDQPLPNPSYALSRSSALLAPIRIEADTASTWQGPGNAYDYIAIVHPSLWDAVQPLLDHRAAEGMRVAKVNLQDVYDEFSYGRLDPEAIRSFLSNAYFNWNQGEAPPQYVLLVGDGHIDFKGFTTTTLPNLLPPYLLDIDPWIGETAADNRYVSVDGPNDYLPDMAIGRLPARNAADVSAIVNKILAYETTAPSGAWQSRVVYVADNYADAAGNFHDLSNQIRDNWLPPAYDDPTIYYNSGVDLDTGEEMRTAIKGAFNNDALMVQWFGHGSIYRWGGAASMFNTFDPVTLNTSVELPLSVSYACWTSYFIGTYNNWQSLGEQLVLEPGKGSVADIGPTGLHIGGSLLTLDQGLTQAIFQDRIDRVGVALSTAKTYYFTNNSSWHDLIDTSILLGDPATRLRLPDLPRLKGSTLAASNNAPAQGTQVTFTLALVNDGSASAANTVAEVDYDQTRLTIVSAPGASNDGDKLTWTVGALPVGTTTQTFVVQINSGVANGTLITTSATIRADGIFNVPLSNTLTVTQDSRPTPTATSSPTPSADAEPDAKPNAEPDAKCDTDPNSHADADRDPDPDRHADADRHADPDRDANPDRHADAGPDANPNRHADAGPDADPNRHADTEPDADPNRHADTEPDP